MATTIKSFEAKVIKLMDHVSGRRLYFLNMDNGAEGFVPEWCIINHVILPDELLDSEGHVKQGAILQLREVDGGKIYPGFCYEHRATQLNKPATLTKKMSRESLYEDAQLYQAATLDSLWNKFAQECQMGQLSSLCAILGVDSVDMIGKQENRFREYKTSFFHSANPLQNERTYQYQQIFREIAAFGNGHETGDVFIGINNNGEITMTWYKTVEEKLFCRISVPKWDGTVILLNGCELYVREDAGKKQLKDKDLIDYILMHCAGKAA